MRLPLMPKATAVWLVENTALTFEQIADFCGMHALEVKGIADGEVATGIVGLDPVASGQVNREELDRCGADPKARLTLLESSVPLPKTRGKGARYTPVSKRQDRPDAIAWILKFHPEISDAQIQKLLGTTKTTINAIRDRSHWNANNIKPRDPVGLGICTQLELDQMVGKAQARRRALAEEGGLDPMAPELNPVEDEPAESYEDQADADSQNPGETPTVESVFGVHKED